MERGIGCCHFLQHLSKFLFQLLLEEGLRAIERASQFRRCHWGVPRGKALVESWGSLIHDGGGDIERVERIDGRQCGIRWGICCVHSWSNDHVSFCGLQLLLQLSLENLDGSHPRLSHLYRLGPQFVASFWGMEYEAAFLLDLLCAKIDNFPGFIGVKLFLGGLAIADLCAALQNFPLSGLLWGYLSWNPGK